MTRPSVGLVVLARDEEALLPRCLASASEVDRMVVLDMHSVDATRAIATSSGAEVVEVPIVRRFDGLRQLGVDRLDTDWVLQLDADEWLPEGLVSRLRAGGHLDQHQPLSFPKMNHLGGRWIKRNGWWPNYQVRMFRRGRGRYTDQFHNYLVTDDPAVRLPQDEAFAIRHEGHTDVEDMVCSAARYLPPPTPLSLPAMIRLSTRPLGAFVLSRGWKDGSDGYAILMTKLLNALSRATSAVD